MTSFDAEMNMMLDRLGAAKDGFVIVALYKFVSLDDIDGLRQTLQQLCDKNQALGTILLAEEGIDYEISRMNTGAKRMPDDTESMSELERRHDVIYKATKDIQKIIDDLMQSLDR